MTPSESFRQKIEAYLARTKMKPSAFGREAVGDGNFVFDLRHKDRMPSLRLVERVENFMKANPAPKDRVSA
jgi:hypothetical protein